MPSIREVFPEFATELADLVAESDKPELAKQIPDLPVVERCRCGQRNCAHFYTATPPSSGYGPNHTNVPLDARRGLITLDVVDGAVVGVEILDRPDVKRRLDVAFPAKR